MRYLILGMSHTTALRAALADQDIPDLEIVNLRNAKEICPNIRGPLHLDKYGGPTPDVVCLLLGGNAHAVLSLLEHPVPFSVGCAAEPGEAPADAPDGPSRHFIPRSLMSDILSQRFDKSVALQSEQIHRHWPEAFIIHVCSPPPPMDVSSVYDRPGLFKANLENGIAPPELRLTVWQVQSELYRALAQRLGGAFLGPVEDAMDSSGFLRPDYASTDPTHANTAYGHKVLDKILSIQGETP